MFEHVSELTVPAIVVDGDGRVLAANSAHDDLIAMPWAQVPGSHVRALVGDQFAQEMLAIARRVIDQGTPRNAVAMWRGHWLRARYSRVELETGFGCLVCVDPWRHPLFEAGATEAQPPEMLAAHDLGDLASLSAREAEVLWMIGQGMSLPQIAKTLVRSNKTIESHVRTISAKIKARGRLAIGLFAQARGFGNMTLEQVAEVFNERPSSRTATRQN